MASVDMDSVDMDLARRLVRASAMAYAPDVASVHASPHFSGSGFIDNMHLQVLKHSSRPDAVLVAQTSFGVVAAFRGTLPPIEIDPRKAWNVALDWINDFEIRLVPADYATGLVHEGFAKSLDSIWDECALLARLQAATSGGQPLYITGHSKGGAVAALAAMRLDGVGLKPAAIITFGSARPGGEDFAAAYDARFAKHWRFEHQNDIVPHAPLGKLRLPFLAQLNETSLFAGLAKFAAQPFGFAYAPVGKLCFIDWTGAIVSEDTPALEAERLRRLLISGPYALLDHAFDKSLRPDGGKGYVEVLDTIA